MALKKSIRRGLVLAALAAGGCGDDDVGDTGRSDAGTPDTTVADMGGRDSAADMAGDMRPSDTGTSDTGTPDTGTPDLGPADMGADGGGMLTPAMAAAIRSACEKIVTTCMSPDYDSVDECMMAFEDYAVYTPACQDAYAALFDCLYMAECSVLADDTMTQAHVDMNCSAEVMAGEAVCG